MNVTNMKVTILTLLCSVVPVLTCSVHTVNLTGAAEMTLHNLLRLRMLKREKVWGVCVCVMTLRAGLYLYSVLQQC